MPTYNFRHRETNEITEQFMSISEMLEFEKEHPELEVMCGKPLIHTGAGLGLKSMRNDDTFKNKLKQIDKQYPRNTLRRNGLQF